MLGYLDDIRSDLSAIHRVDDMEAMNSVRFAQLAPRLSAYQGVMAIRVSNELAEDEPEYQEQQYQPAQPRPDEAVVTPIGIDLSDHKVVPLSHPDFAGWIEHAEVG